VRVFTVRIQLPEGMDDNLMQKLLAQKINLAFHEAELGTLRSQYGALRLYPSGTAVQINDEHGELVFSSGSFRQPRPDAESAAEEKGDAEREGDR
jgi:hypothetical protein